MRLTGRGSGKSAVLWVVRRAERVTVVQEGSIVLSHSGRGDVLDGYQHEFRSLHGCAQIEVTDICR